MKNAIFQLHDFAERAPVQKPSAARQTGEAIGAFLGLCAKAAGVGFCGGASVVWAVRLFA